MGGHDSLRRGRDWAERLAKGSTARIGGSLDPLDCGPASRVCPYHQGRVALALGRSRLADAKVALLVDQPPFVEVRQHHPRRLFGKVGRARQTDVLAQLIVDLAER